MAPRKKSTAKVTEKTPASSTGVKKTAKDRKTAVKEPQPTSTRRHLHRSVRAPAPPLPEADEEEGGLDGIERPPGRVADEIDLQADLMEAAVNRMDVLAERTEASVLRTEAAAIQSEGVAERVNEALNRIDALAERVQATANTAARRIEVAVETAERLRSGILAKVENDFECLYKGEKAFLRVELEVHTDPNDFKSRLGYRARLNLVLKGDSLPKEIGHIHSWRMNKPTQTHRIDVEELHDSPWLIELLTPYAQNVHSKIRETMYCMSALYDETGKLKTEARHLENELGDEVIFIEMIYIFEQYQKEGLLQAVMHAYFDLLPELPEWYAFAGTLLLIPSRPEGPRGKAWGKRTDKQVEDKLRKMYKNIGFVDYVKDGKVNIDKMTAVKVSVMGKTLAEEDTSAHDEDRGRSR